MQLSQVAQDLVRSVNPLEAIFGGRGAADASARSLFEFQRAFPDKQSCAEVLFERRWPQGFMCPTCGSDRA